MAELLTTSIRCQQQLDSYRLAWSELVSEHPMRSPDWMLGWWDQFSGDDKQLNVLVVEDGQTLVGLAPLYIDRIGDKEVFHLLGSGYVCTDHATWFARDGMQVQVGEAIAEFFLNTESWHRVHLESIDQHDLAMNASLSKLEQSGCLVSRTPTWNRWTINLPNLWEDYLTTLSKSHRKRCRRLHREYFESGRIQVTSCESLDDFASSWEAMLDLHVKRWADATHPLGAFTDPRLHDFHKSLAIRLLQQRRLRLVQLECDGLAIAAEYQNLDKGTLFAYQSGMNPEHGSFQPGNLSLIASIQYAIDHGLHSLDLLRGDEPYKAHWRATPTACHDIRIWPGKLTDHVAATMQHARDIAKQWLRPN